MRRLPILPLFFLSGISALIYQTSWIRQTTLVFGVSVYAYAVVLAAFMGGSALGSAWVGRRADRVVDGLPVFAGLQVGVALFAVLILFALPALMPVYAGIARGMPADSWLLTAVRAFFSALLLIPPTFLMGATLPVMARSVARRSGAVGHAVGQLYAAETLGAAIGCGLAGLFLLRILGTQQTVFVAAALNLLTAAGAWWLSRKSTVGSEQLSVVDGKSPTARGKLRTPNTQYPISAPQSLLLAAYALSGFVALGYEVVWARILAVFTLDAVFSFSIMLTTYLLGLTLGGWLGAQWMGHRQARWSDFAGLQAALGLAALGTIFVFARLPGLALEDVFGVYSVTNLVLFEFLLGFLALILPTTLLGLLFPVVVSLYTGERTESVGQGIGRIAALNTGGAIFGSLVVGFGLIPWLGLQSTLISLGLVNLLLGAGGFWLGRKKQGRWWTLPAAAGVVASLLILLRPSSLYLGFRQGPSEQLIFYGEGVETTVAVFEVLENDFKVSFVNGRIEVPTDEISMRAFRMLGHLPALLRPDAQRALMLSFGNGIATGSLDTHAIPFIDAVDLSAEQFQAAELYWQENYNVLRSPRLHTHVEDGRNFLLQTPYHYDIITTDATHPSNTSSWALFTREFYESVADRLAADGVFVQWLPFHSLLESDYKMILRTFASLFPNATLWYTGGSHTLLVATPQPLTEAELDRMVQMVAQNPIALDDLERASLVRAYLAMDTDTLRGYAGPGPLSTDDRAFFLPYADDVEFIRQQVQAAQSAR